MSKPLATQSKELEFVGFAQQIIVDGAMMYIIDDEIGAKKFAESKFKGRDVILHPIPIFHCNL
jgi:hypothetical protein